MVKKTDNKELYNEWVEYYYPKLVEVHQILKPHIEHWYQFAKNTQNVLNELIEEHKESIEIWMQLAKVYPQLEPHIENIALGLENPNFEIANDVIQFTHILQAIDIKKDPKNASIFNVISNEKFQLSLTSYYDNSSLDSRRLPLIKEALELHNLGYYAGSTSILYGQIEGVLTESFIKAGYMTSVDGRLKPVKKDGSHLNKNLNGLVPKLRHATTRNDSLKDFYSNIETYQLFYGDSEQTIPKTRNEVLHGESLDFNTEERSAQLILWLYSITIEMRVLNI